MLDRLAEAGVERRGGQCPRLRRPAGGAPGDAARDPEILISDERAALLETGGGLKQARALLGRGPIWVANIDTSGSRAATPALEALVAGLGPGADGRLPAAGPARPHARLRHAAATSSGDDGRRARPTAAGGRARRCVYIGVQIARPAARRRRPPTGRSRCSRIWKAAGRRRAGCTASCSTGFWMHVGDPAARDAAEARLGRSGDERASSTGRRRAGSPSPAHRPFLDGPGARACSRRSRRAARRRCRDAVVLMPTRRGAPRAWPRPSSTVGGGRALLLPQIRAAGRPRRGRAAVRAGRPGAGPAAGDRAAAPALRAGAAGRRARSTCSAARSTPPARWSWPTPWRGFLDSLRDRGGRRRCGRSPTWVEADLARHWQVSARFLDASRWTPGRRGWTSSALIDVDRAARARCCARWPSAGRASRRPGR